MAALPGYGLLGVLVGAIAGLGQTLAWRLPGQRGWRWLWANMAGYGLAFPGGALICLLTASNAWGLRTGTFLFIPLAEPGSIIYLVFPGSLVYGGFLAGLCQWLALRPLLARATHAMHAPWVLGVWFGVGLGLFLGGPVISSSLL